MSPNGDLPVALIDLTLDDDDDDDAQVLGEIQSSNRVTSGNDADSGDIGTSGRRDDALVDDILQQRRNFMALVHESRIKGRRLPTGLRPPPELPSPQQSSGSTSRLQQRRESIRSQLHRMRNKMREKWRQSKLHTRNRVRTLSDLHLEDAAIGGRSGVASDQERSLAMQVFVLTNQYRQRHGLHPLQWCEQLADIAQRHSHHMARQGRLSHDRFSERIAHYPHRMALENVACNSDQSDPASTAMNGWIESPGHHRNILHPAPSLLGVGVCGSERDGMYYMTQIFAG